MLYSNQVVRTDRRRRERPRNSRLEFAWKILALEVVAAILVVSWDWIEMALRHP